MNRSTSFVMIALLAPLLGAGAQATATTNDPRAFLKGGWNDAAEAISNLELVSHTPRPAGFFSKDTIGSFALINSDLAFRGNLVFQGNFNGFQVWDIVNPMKPVLRSSLVCPGGQGDMSIYGHLLFMSVEEPRGRVDCGPHPVMDSVSAERFRGVRIFDISNIDHPRQVAAVQTCRGSHTHTLVTDPRDKANIYVYVSGVSYVRSPNELKGCSAALPNQDSTTSLFRIDIIKVPLANPSRARVVSSPRIFADSLGGIAGLWPGGAHGAGTQNTARTDQCHDVTVYPAIGLAAGACSGNGILLDIRDPAHPRRISEVNDPNFAYWHSATFNNDGSAVVFTDEWGGGVAPRCRVTDRKEWGADAVFSIKDRKLVFAGYYKLPVAQTNAENCVAHNGGIIPVPGRDIMAQGWYQGGVSLFDFTDPAHPTEIAYFDRGPVDPASIILAGSWGAYWYNGYLFSSELARGLDILALKPSDQLSQNEIDAAKLVRFAEFNPQDQPKFVWPASFVVARAYLDQLARNNGLAADRMAAVTKELARAEKMPAATRRPALGRLAAALDRDAAGAGDPTRVRSLAAAVRKLAGPTR